MIPSTRSRIATTLRAAAPPAFIAVVAAVLLRFPPAQYSFYPQCPIHEMLHLQCPGCGATRAVASLLRGNLAEAMHFNALVTLLLPFAAAFGILSYTRLLRRGQLLWPQPPVSTICVALAITVVFTVARNLPNPLF